MNGLLKMRENETPKDDGFPWNLLTVWAAKVAGEPEVREKESVEDYTNFSLFRHQLALFVIKLVDQIFATSVNIITAVLFTAIWSVFAFFARFDVTSSAGKRILEGVKKHVTTKVSTFVTLSTPNIYDTLFEKERNFEPSTKDFSLDNALFLLNLSTLVYEETPVIKQVLKSLKQKGQSITHKAILKESCVFHAFYNVERRYVVLVFKGTSPLNFTEWLTDFTLSKIAADGHLMPGEVHEGFYNAFEFPSHIHKRSSSLFDSHSATPAHYEEINSTIADVLKEFDSKPNIWITGHSLGAALASVFFSYTVCGDEDMFPVLNPLRRALVGAYTYGTPRTGNYVYDEEVTYEYRKLNKVFHRVVNANDIVCVAPLGGNTFVQWLMSKVTPHGRNLMSLTDYHHIGDSFVFPYYGRYEQNDHPSLLSRVPNIFANFFDNFLAWFRMFAGQETLYSAMTRQVTPFLLFDHFPSEYERHIAKHLASEQSLNFSFSLPKKDD